MSDEEELPTGFLVSATLRIADRAGVPITVRRRGYEQSGTIILKINRLDGTSDVLTQIRMGDERVWAPVKADGAMRDADAEAYMDRQEKSDPDSWLLEIDDREGRHWFPGRRID